MRSTDDERWYTFEAIVSVRIMFKDEDSLARRRAEILLRAVKVSSIKDVLVVRVRTGKVYQVGPPIKT